MDSWADGLNYYLATHPQVKPRVLTRFEPWMALSFTEGSIGGDIERIDLGELEKFYSGTPSRRRRDVPDSRTARVQRHRDRAGADRRRQGAAADQPAHQLLLPLRAASDQRPGPQCLWRGDLGAVLHLPGVQPPRRLDALSSGVDNVDEFTETGRAARGALLSLWPRLAAAENRPVTIRYRTADGGWARATSPTWRTHRGPIVRAQNGRWIAFAMMDRPVAALQQAFCRTKATDLASFLASRGSRRTAPTTPSLPTTRVRSPICTRSSCRGATTASTTPGRSTAAIPRPTGARFTRSRASQRHQAGPTAGSRTPTPGRTARRARSAPNAARFPRYMDTFGENFRGLHMQQLLTGSGGWTLDKLQAAAFDTDQPGFRDAGPAADQGV